MTDGQYGTGAEPEADHASRPFIDPARDAIFLDVDGTLLDIAPSPREVRVPAALLQTLNRLATSTHNAVALVSGRQLETLDALFAPVRTAAIGCHGAEMRRSPDAPTELRARPMPPTLRHALDDIAVIEPQIRIEDKRFARAFHFRRARDRESSLLALLQERVGPFAHQYCLLRGKSVIEVKPLGINKGEALLALSEKQPFAGRRPVFFGDDRTDEDVFGVLPRLNGLGISVGRHMAHADFMVHGPREVRRWLAELVEHEKAHGHG